MNPYYRSKGRYGGKNKDNRQRIVIEIPDENRSVTLPKPEILLEILKRGFRKIKHFNLLNH